jgi:hypothetical protein
MAIHAPPLLDDDVWRFVWDSWLTTEGLNPYHHLPVDFLGQDKIPHTMMPVMDRVAYPDAPTIYGPGLQAVFAAAAWLAPGQLWAWKLLLWFAHVTLLLALRDQPRAWLVLLAPPVFFEFALNGHPDIIAIAFMAWAWRSSAKQPLLAGLLMALCVACRVQGYVVLPFFLWSWPWRGRITWALSMVAIYLPLLALGSATEWTGIAAFGALWEFNSSLVALLGSDATARRISLCLAAILCSIAFVKWVRSGAVLNQCPALYCIGCVLVCSAVFNPWYALWMLPFLALQAGSAWRYAWLGLPSLSYITQGNLGTDWAHAFTHPSWVRPLEFSLLALATWWASRGSAASQSASSSTSQQLGNSTHGM